MNKFKKALCENHQRDKRISGATKNLQELTKNRHKDELKREIPKLVTIKDWINADFETWDKVNKKKCDDPYIIKTSDEDTKNSHSRYINNKAKY